MCEKEKSLSSVCLCLLHLSTFTAFLLYVSYWIVVFSLCSVFFLILKMSRVKFMSTSAILQIIENCSDDDDSEMQFDNLTNVVCLPPPYVDEVSDEECLDDEEITFNEATDQNPLEEVAGRLFYDMI